MPIKKISLNIAIICLFLIPLFPLIVANSYFFPFITGKGFLFRALVELALACYVILAFADVRYRPKMTKTSIAVLVFAGITLVADLLGVNPLRSVWSNFERMEGWITIAHLVAFYFVIGGIFGHYEANKTLWRRWFAANLGVASVIGVYGLLQMVRVLEIHQGSSRIDATLGNSAYMAVYLLFALGLAVFMFIAEEKKRSFKINGSDSRMIFYWSFMLISVLVLAFMANSQTTKLFFESLQNFINAHPLQLLIGLIISALLILYPYKVLPLLTFFLIFQTQTRGTILGMLGGIFVALVYYVIFANNKHRVGKYVSVSILALIVIITSIFYVYRKSSFVTNNEVLNRLGSISINDVKTQARGYVWPMALKGFSQRPILGWGQENFNYIFNANYEPAMYRQEQWFDRAHSVFLDWLVASGAVGLLVYISLYVLLIINIFKSDLSIGKKATLIGLVAGYFVHNIFVFDNIASYILFFSILAFGNNITHEKSKVLLGDRTYDRDAVEYVVLPIVVVLLVFVFYQVEYRLVASNSRLLQALASCAGGRPDVALFEKALEIDSTTANQEIREQLLNCSTRVITAPQAPMEIKQRFLTVADTEIKKQINYAPKDARMYVLGGSFMNSIGQYTQAVPLLEKALELSPRKQSIIYELVSSYLNVGNNSDKALTLIKEAYESSKDNDAGKLAYATTLISADKEKEARELYKDNLDALAVPQIAQVYINKKQYYKAIEIYRSLIKREPKEINYRSQLAQIQYMAGLKYDAIETLREIAKDYPEYKEQVENAIKQLSK